MSVADVRPPGVTPAGLSGYNGYVTTDSDLVRATLGGDVGAFAALMDRHARMCLRYATRMLGNREDAEDAAQETFVRAYGALNRYDGRVAFQTWLMTILINRCRTMLAVRHRHNGREVLHGDVKATLPVGADEDGFALRDAIERAVARLDPSQREAFLLKHVEELSYEEMSTVTGVGVSALKMRVQRACERLQGYLEDDRHD